MELCRTSNFLKYGARIPTSNGKIIVGQKILTHPAFRGGCLVGLISGTVAESSEPMVLGYLHTVLQMDAQDGADTSAFDGRSEML